MATQRPPRVIDPYAERFWAFTEQQELRLQRCGECGRFRWPPGPVCDQCLSEDYAWEEVSGRATLLSWVIYRRQYFPEYPDPHTVLMVELDEGPLLVTQPLEIQTHELRDGLALELSWLDGEDRHGAYQLPVFRPAR